MKRTDIKNETLVRNTNNGLSYHRIQDIGNAFEKGDRERHGHDTEELSYSIVNILTGEVEEGICEHSHMTSNCLSVATEREAELFLLKEEADALMKLAKAKKQLAVVQNAMFQLKQ